MLLARVVAASDAVAATRARSAKVATLAELLGALRERDPHEIESAVGFLIGEPRQGRVGVGWATLAGVRRPESGHAGEPTVEVLELDSLLARLALVSGSGSAGTRSSLLADFFARLTEREADFVWRLMVGELRQGALEGVMADAVAKAASVPAALVRRAAMLSGDLRVTASLALRDGAPGLDAVKLHVGRPVLPMLAATSADVDSALSESGPASVEWKLDGARIQVHRLGHDVRVFTRNLNDVTDRLPAVVDAVRSLPVRAVVLDGEAIGFDDEARPRAFQDTMSDFGSLRQPDGPGLHAFFFDVLHVDGSDLIDEPLAQRGEVLHAIAPDLRIPAIVTADPIEAQRFAESSQRAGHEGVMVKSLRSLYEAGRRGSSWRKVKPVLTVDLVVLAAEWGHGRRQGWLSNLHLGAAGGDPARQPSSADDAAAMEFVMVGKTFKGLTDAMLTWQTEQFLAREIGREGHVVYVRPELVVEIALDGVQRSSRYPGGVALRFARVKRYRTDKSPLDVDRIERLQAMRDGG